MRKILILRDDHFGDAILTTGLIRNLAHAGYHVDLLCKAIWTEAFQHSPHGTAHGFGKDGIPSASQPRLLGEWIKHRRYDHLLVPYRDTRLLAASWHSGVPQRWAQMGGVWSRLTLHHSLPAKIERFPRHMADVWLDFARALKITVDNGHPELFLTEQEKDDMMNLVKARMGETEYVVIHPFHGRSSCNWPLPKYVELALQLARRGIRTIITGSQSERPLLEGSLHQLEDAGAWVSCGEFSLRQFLTVVGLARLLVCSSTGALHISSALNVPSLSLFCPHPLVNATLWHSFADGSKVLTPPSGACPRFQDPCQHCQFSDTLSVDNVFQQSLAMSEASPSS